MNDNNFPLTILAKPFWKSFLSQWGSANIVWR